MSNIDDRVDSAMLLLNADRVGPKARHQLRGLLKFYAKKPHPFRACVRDNTKRFGKKGAERICATLKDLIRGQKKWRGKNNPKDHGVAPWIMASEDNDLPILDDDVAEILLTLPDDQIDALERLLWDG